MAAFDDHAPDALLRLMFISRANFSNWADARGVELEISRIMYPSPRTSADDRVGGIFHQRNRWFLQCIEGPRDALQAVWQRHLADPRHTDSTIRVLEPIERRSFPPGAMRYAGMRPQLRRLRERHGLDGLELHDLPPKLLDELIDDYIAAHRAA